MLQPTPVENCYMSTGHSRTRLADTRSGLLHRGKEHHSKKTGSKKGRKGDIYRNVHAQILESNRNFLKPLNKPSYIKQFIKGTSCSERGSC